MRYAVYVEGQSEMLFVADVLQKYSNYDPSRYGFLCINLHAGKFQPEAFPKQGDEHSASYYQIVNVNNDNTVVPKLRKDIPNLLESGFDVIIGLKDVFGDAYRHITKEQPVVDREKIEAMHAVQHKAIAAPEGCDCRLHFAIMEYEAWMLALIESYVREHGQDLAAICQEL